MRLVTAIIQPAAVDDVRHALERLAVLGMTVTQAQGYGQQKGHTEVYRGSKHQQDMVRKLRIETLVSDSIVERVVDAVAKAARTRQIGDGKIWVSPVYAVIRIRTGERDDDAV